jgi:ABC-2 type transport system ATP-binding protein
LRRLIELLGQKGKMVLFSSHVLEVVERVCSRVVILSGGRVVADDSIARLRELSKKPSLEAVFAQLAVSRDIDEIAGGILDAIST